MIVRPASVASRLSIVALLGAAACSGGPGTGTGAPAPTPAATAETRAAAEPTPAAPRVHGPGGWFFRQVETLDLRDDQRAAVAAARDKLAADLVPHHEVVRQEIVHLADAIQVGRLDPEKAAEQKAALLTVVAKAKASLAQAVNAVHDTLDASQRVALVAQLEKQREERAHPDARHSHGLAKLAFEIGMTEEQQAKISEAFGKGLDELFPDRKARREAWEAKTKAMAEAFVTDDFDAADFDLADHAEEAVASFLQIASRGVDVSSHVLSGGQRELAAGWMRERAQEL
jgi:Spy/CpxP family protein refolding chaperone